MAHQSSAFTPSPIRRAACWCASDGNTTSLQAPTLNGLGPVGDGAHAPHEVDRMPERAALLVGYLWSQITACVRKGRPSAISETSAALAHTRRCSSG